MTTLVYELLLLLGGLLYVPRALWRRRLPHAGWTMRLGRYPAAVTQALRGRATTWVHAVSVGEALASRPLIQALAQADPAMPLILSSVTAGGFAIAAQQVPPAGVVVYFPVDLRVCVGRALAALRPRLLLLMEWEFWPTMARRCREQGVPVVILNGRISPRAFHRYRWVRPWLRRRLGDVALFLMQSEADAERARILGAPRERVRVTGSLKWDASVSTRPSAQTLQAAAVRLGLNGRDPVLVAGSTHAGEEDAILQTVQALRADGIPLRVILAPRHLERLADVERLVHDRRLTAVRTSQGSGDGRWDVGLVDAFGQLPLYYGLGAVAFVGGSLIPHGGQNPLEPASLGRPVVFGPSMHNFADIAGQLLAAGAARQLRGAGELTGVVRDLLREPAAAEAMGRRAEALMASAQGATQRTLEALQPFLSVAAART